MKSGFKAFKVVIVVFSLILISAFLVSDVLCQKELLLDEEEKVDIIKKYYKYAIEAYNRKNYVKAIEYWSKILEIDPNQRQPKKLIDNAEKKAKTIGDKIIKDAMKKYENGEYLPATEELTKALELGLKNKKAKKILGKLKNITLILNEEKGSGRISKLIRSGIVDYVNNNIKVAINKFRYVCENQKDNEKSVKIKVLLETEYPEIAREDVITSGMGIIEWKLFVSLNHIYSGRYDLAIGHCNEILELEPDNITALMRLGSAYYTLNDNYKAKKTWERALKLDPDNKVLKKFLKKD